MGILEKLGEPADTTAVAPSGILAKLGPEPNHVVMQSPTGGDKKIPRNLVKHYEAHGFVQKMASSGIAKFAAPMIGDAAGGILGAGAGAAIGTVGALPGPGTIAGGVLGLMGGAAAGAGSMEALRQKLAGEDMDPGAIGSTAAWSGALAPVGLAFGPGIRGIRALGGAGGVATAGKTFLQGINKNAEEAFLKKAASTAAKASEVAAVGYKGALHEAAAKSSAVAEAAGEHVQELTAGHAAKLENIAQQAGTKTEQIAAEGTQRLHEIGTRAELANQSLQASLQRRSKDLLDKIGPKIEQRFPGAMEHLAAGKSLGQVQSELGQSIAEHKALVAAADNTGVAARPMDLLPHVLETVDKLHEAGSPMAAQLHTRIASFYRSLGLREGEKLTPSRVLKIKQGAGTAVSGILNQQGARVVAGEPLTGAMGKSVEHNFQEALRKGAEDWLDNNVEGVAARDDVTRSLMGAKQALTGMGGRLARMSEAAAATDAANTAKQAAMTTSTQAKIATRLAKLEAQKAEKLAATQVQHAANVAKLAAAHDAAQTAIKTEMGGKLVKGYEKLAARHAASGEWAESKIAASRAAKSAKARSAAARVITAGAAMRVPGFNPAMEGLMGFSLGHLAEPATTPFLHGAFSVLGHPVTQKVIQYAPRSAVAVMQSGNKYPTQK